MELHLGAVVDPATGDRGDELCYDASDLTTHGVIVGMTGSGKTGLGVVFLEEALRNGVPALVIDPKGDMTNLALSFPGLSAAEFGPWIDPHDDGDSADDVAARWRDGLAGWGLGPEDVAALRERAGITVYTPGSTAGVPLDVIGRMAPPSLSWDDEAEAIRSEIQGMASGLLGLVGVDADPIGSREHILICNVVEHAWRAGTALDMATLLAWIQRPPLRKLGVFDVDSFIPEGERRTLAMKLNGLLASPAFSTWMQGLPLDIDRLLWREGRPQAAIVTLAHLGDAERQFVVTLLLSRLITWMRGQPGSSSLRLVAYMDEVFGFCPPTAMPPAKMPMLTLLKQGRAFGIGMLLATQNPVDLDYKAMSNAGTWAIGRLQTERDKERILEGLRSASGDVDVASLGTTIAALPKRTFVLHDTHRPVPVVFTTRWAMSYLRGPLTRDEISRLRQDIPPQARPPVPPASVADDTVGAMPPVAAGIAVGHLDPAAPWAPLVGGDAAGQRYRAAATVRLRTHYDEARAGISHDEEWEAVVHPLTDPIVPERQVHLADHDPRDRLGEPPRPGRYELPAAPIDAPGFFRGLERDVVDHARRNATLTVMRNAHLGLHSRPGEPPEAFAARCREAAEERTDEEVAKLARRYEERIQRGRRRLQEAVARAEGEAERLRAEQQDDLLDHAGMVLDVLAGRRRSGSAAASRRRSRQAERRLHSAEDRVETAAAAVADLETEMVSTIEEIEAGWLEKVDRVEEVDIGLERDDIAVVETALLWVLGPDR